MSPNKTLDFIQNELASDQPNTTLLNALKVVQPGIDRLTYDAAKNAKEDTYEECICRLLASGMGTEEVVAILCIRKEDVEIVIHNNKAKIAKYAKTLKERKKRRGMA